MTTSRYTCSGPDCGYTTTDLYTVDAIDKSGICPECGWEAFQADFTEEAPRAESTKQVADAARRFGLYGSARR